MKMEIIGCLALAAGVYFYQPEPDLTGNRVVFKAAYSTKYVDNFGPDEGKARYEYGDTEVLIDFDKCELFINGHSAVPKGEGVCSPYSLYYRNELGMVSVFRQKLGGEISAFTSYTSEVMGSTDRNLEPYTTQHKIKDTARLFLSLFKD